MKNVKKHLTLSALIVASAILFEKVFAEEISSGEQLATIIAADGERNVTLSQDITAIKNLGDLAGTQLTINGNNFGISGEKDENINLTGLYITQSISFILDNLSAFANFLSETGGAIYNRGDLSITNTNFLNNTATVNGGAIYNRWSLSLSDSSFLNNTATSNGGAIYNSTSIFGTLNIIASTKDVSFSGNTKNNISNDIYNTGSTINLYSAAEKTLSFGGGIEGLSSTININVTTETITNVAGTVLFKTGSITSGNNFTFGAGILKLESGVYQNWTNNSLTQTGGVLNLQNNATESTNFVNFNSSGGTVDIDIDLAAGTSDQINVTGTLTKAAEIGNINFLTPNVGDSTQSIAIGNGLHLTGTKDIVTTTTLANNYTKVWLAQSKTISNSLDVVRLQSINAAIKDSSVATREISLIQNISATANFGTLAGTQLTINGNNFGITGNYGSGAHHKGITIGNGQTLIVNNISSWNGFGTVFDADGSAIRNRGGTVDITNSVFSNNFASSGRSSGGAIYNSVGMVTITNSDFSNNYISSGGNGGAICNNSTLTITDSSFSDNFTYAYVSDGESAFVKGGAIYNSEGTVNIIAKDNNSSFSGNYTQILGREKTNNDIYNYGSSESSGIINLYATSEKTISFEGGIVSEGNSSSVNINVASTEYTDVAGTVLFKSDSINSDNNFTLGAGTLKLERDVSQNWRNNSLTQTSGTVDLANGAIETTAFSTLNSTGGGAILDINLVAGTADQITATTSTNAIELSGLKNIGSLEIATKTINVGNGVKITNPLTVLTGTTENNYHQMIATKSAVANSIDIVYEQSLNTAITDKSTGDHLIKLIKDTTASADLGLLKGSKLTIDANNFKLLGDNKSGITVAARKTLITKNVNEWSGFSSMAYGAIALNLGTMTIEDSNISSNTSSALGGAISNESILNIAAVSTNTTFTGNKASSSSVANDIHSFNGTTNIYAANEKTVSFDGGIAGEESSIININVKGSTTYDVAGTVLFKTDSINSNNDFILGAGTLKLEKGVSQNWTNNSLTQTGGALNLQNDAIETTNFINFNSSGGTVDIDIDLSTGTADQINVTGTLTKTAEIGKIKHLPFNIDNVLTQSILIGNGLRLSETKDIVTNFSLATNYTKIWVKQSSTANSIDVVYKQSIEAAIVDSSVDTREIKLLQNVSATTNLGTLVGTQLTIEGSNFGISGSHGTNSHCSRITVNSGQTLIVNNVGSVDATGNLVNSWNGFALTTTIYDYYYISPYYDYAKGGAIYNDGTLKIKNSAFSGNHASVTNNSAYAYAYAYAYGGAIYNSGKATITGSSFSENYTTNTGIHTDSDGGAIYNIGTITIIDSNFSENRNGAISNAGTIEVDKSTFSKNYANNGTISNQGQATITDSSFSENQNGTIYNTGTITITDSSFSENYTHSSSYYPPEGGVIKNYYIMTITNSTFSNNYASATETNFDYAHAFKPTYGGVIYNSSAGSMTIINTIFSGNYTFAMPSSYGGTIYNIGTMTITDSSFSGNYATVTPDSYDSTYGGAIYNIGTMTITDSSFSNNYAKASAYAYTYGGAIYNDAGDINIIAEKKDSVFLGNYTQVEKNDIYNYGSISSSGTINLYAATGKMISFDGGIVSEIEISENKESKGTSSVNINVKSSTTYDVNGTVLFKANSINSYNKFILGAGTLKLENGVTWTSNTLALNGGTLDIGSSTGNDIGTLNYDGGSLTLKNGANINIDISGTGNDKIVFFNNAQLILEGGHQITVDLNYDAAIGDNFIIMSGFNWTGMLDENCVMLSSNPEDWNIDKHLVASITQINGTNSLLLTVAAIPEPSMFGLFAGLATLALVGTRRRRK